MGRFRELDGLRGIAALFVVLSHVTGTHNTIYVDDPPPLVDLWWGGLGVQLFFLISGFVILMSAQGSDRPSDFVISRATRLYPAYWLSLVIAVVIAWSTAMPKIPLEPWVIGANLSMVQRWFLIPNVLDVYWTLAVEMQFYVLLLMLLLITRGRITDRLMVRVAAVWLVVSLVVAVWAFPRSHGLGAEHVATSVKLVLNATLAAYGPLFSAGMLACLSRRRGALHPLLIPALLIAVLTTGLVQTWVNAGFVAGIGTAFLLVTMRPTTRILTVAPLQWLGKISYSLYLVHSVVSFAVIHALWPLIGREGAALVAIAASLLAGWAVYEVAERRISRWARRSLLAWRDRRPRRTTKAAAG